MDRGTKDNLATIGLSASVLAEATLLKHNIANWPESFDRVAAVAEPVMIAGGVLVLLLAGIRYRVGEMIVGNQNV